MPLLPSDGETPQGMDATFQPLKDTRLGPGSRLTAALAYMAPGK